MWAAKDREMPRMTPSFRLARGCLLNERSSDPTAEASPTDAPPPPHPAVSGATYGHRVEGRRRRMSTEPRSRRLLALV